MSERDATMNDTTLNGRSRTPVLVAGLVALTMAAALLWFFVIRDTSAADVNTADAAAARQASLDEANAGSFDGVEGVWTVDTTFGTFDEACLSDVCDATFAGFRIDEELASFGDKTVIGRSPAVSGSVEISGTSISSANIVVDMTGILTDSGGRTAAIRSQSIETAAFPEASFVLNEPIDIGPLPGDGEQVTVQATGDFTIHGVTKTETLDLTAEINGGVIVVFGQLGPVLLDDYGIAKPSAAVVLSVEDNALIEFQLFLTKR
ncbi:MAG: YceI family protein [Acidimicrobiales bacterium]